MVNMGGIMLEGGGSSECDGTGLTLAAVNSYGEIAEEADVI
jgi:hypothetical protein